MDQSGWTTELLNAGEAVAARRQLEQAQANLRWLEAHWGQFVPQARGKYLAVAGQEAFVAETAEEAWNWASETHPEDQGALVQFVRCETGPRV